MNINKKNYAIVTGAGNGIGKAIAIQLQFDGFDLVAIDKEFETQDFDTTILGDVNDEETISLAEEKVSKTAVNIVLVNAAGITVPNTDEHNWLVNFDKTLSTNLRAPFIWSKRVSKIQRNIGKGRIINISSLASFLAFPDNPGYDVSKGGILQLTKSFAHLLGPFGITCNAIAPGYIRTKMTEQSLKKPEIYTRRIERTLLKRIGTPEDIANVASFLASEKSSYITGQQIVVDGGYSIQGV